MGSQTLGQDSETELQQTISSQVWDLNLSFSQTLFPVFLLGEQRKLEIYI